MRTPAWRVYRRKRQTGKWRARVIGTAAIVCGAALIWFLFVPAAEWLAHHDVGAARGSALETALQNARSAYLTLAAGILAAGALYFTHRNYGLSREGQVTDRYTKAIEQLGSDKIDVRIGGIFALERIALDSARDHPTVMEVLAAFLRERAESPGERTSKGSLARFLSERDSTPAEQTSMRTKKANPQGMPQDVRAAITVIGRRDDSQDDSRNNWGLDLEGARLIHADLSKTVLTHANLARANLTEANLRGAYLTDAALTGSGLIGANMIDADLTRANLIDADLTRANLAYATLVDALLHDAIMADAFLPGAKLSGARLLGTKLADAILPGAHLIGADLQEASLPGANLRGAKLHGANMISAYLPRANLTYAHLDGATLVHANLLGATLADAHLDGAHLAGAILAGANLIGARLDGADLVGARLDGAEWSDSVSPPAGWVRDPDGKLQRVWPDEEST